MELLGWATLLVPGWLLSMGLPVSVRCQASISPVGMGFLRRGERGALATAAIALHAGRHVVVSRRGLLQRGKSPTGTTRAEPLAGAVYAAIPVPTRVRALAARPRVRSAVATLVGELAAAGLVPGRARWLLARGILIATAAFGAIRVLDPDLIHGQRAGYVTVLLLAIVAWWVPRRTIAGYRTLHRLRREYAATIRPPTADPQPVGLAAAATAYALAGLIPPGMAAALARGPIKRSPDDQPSDRDYNSGPGVLP